MKSYLSILKPVIVMKKEVIIIGAGPGGLTAAMLLLSKGYSVTVLEKNDKVGGRNQELKIGNYTFDTGPTFLMLKHILEEVFTECGEDINKHLKLTRLDPMYQLRFSNYNINISQDTKKMESEIKRIFLGQEKHLVDYKKEEEKRYNAVYPCLQKDYSTFSRMFNSTLIKAIPRLSLTNTVWQVLGKYFKSDNLKLCFTFQSKYLGMSAWECPGAFSMLSFVEHKFGIWHVEGGLSEISKTMAKIIEKKGGKIIFNTEVTEILKEKGKVTGVRLKNNKIINTEKLIINADFCNAMSKISKINKYKKENLRKKKFSCSTYMVYLGIDKLYDIPHHTVCFANDYKTNVDNIFKNNKLSEDFSFYIRNSSVTDKTVAPKGHSQLYILMPTPNLKANIDWDKEKDVLYKKVIAALKTRMGLTDIEKHIKVKHIITPNDWQNNYDVFLGATFNLAHNLTQMLYLRPHNRFSDIKGVYLVGGGTHPGSGLPTIYESARISVNLLEKDS